MFSHHTFTYWTFCFLIVLCVDFFFIVLIVFLKFNAQSILPCVFLYIVVFVQDRHYTVAFLP